MKIEEVISVEKAYEYMWDLITRNEIGKSFPEFENLIKCNSTLCFYYALNISKQRFLEGEEVIKNDPILACNYAVMIIKGRFITAEPYIKKDLITALTYVKDIIQDRWPEIEDAIITTHPDLWKQYLRLLKKYEISREVRWRWLKTEVNEKIIDILNTIGFASDMKEYVIQQRPDLINKIKELHSDLKEKYSHELCIGKVEI